MAEQRKIVTSLPENSETPIEDIRSWVTPNRLFFVRNHFKVPEIALDDWQLRIEGLVERPMVLTWNELSSFPQRTVFATMECAGNGRSFLQPRVAGVVREPRSQHRTQWPPAEHEPVSAELLVQDPLRVSGQLRVTQQVMVCRDRVSHQLAGG